MNPIVALAAVALAGWIIYNRMRGDVYQAKSQVVPAVIVGAIGVGDIPSTLHPSGLAYAVGVVALLLAIAVGAARGMTVQLGEEGGLLHARYRVRTLLLWVVGLAVNVGLHLLVPASTPAGALLPHLMTVGIAAGILAEVAVVMARAIRRPHTVAWSVSDGRDATPVVRRAAFVERLQQRAHGGAKVADGIRWE